MKSNTKTILSRESIEKIMKKHFGEEVLVQNITESTEGWFNAVYMVSFKEPAASYAQEVVLKTGVQEHKYILTYEKEIMRTELFVYDALSNTTVPVPKILVRDFSRSLVDCNYFIMEKLRGDNWEHLEEKITPENKQCLVAELAGYTAAMSKIRGDWFGYIKEEKEFQYQDWRSAFQGMVDMLIRDGRKDGVDLPYEQVLDTLAPLWPLLDEVKEASLVNFDMWKKNIMLKEVDGVFVIDGIIDHERAFFGDPYAEFISSETICGPVEENEVFMEHYSKVSGKPFTYTYKDKTRLLMYKLYVYLLIGVEIYRYNEKDAEIKLAYSRKNAEELIALLKQRY